MPADLERICLKCLSKDATQRYLTAADLAEDLRHAHQAPQRRKRRMMTIASVVAAGLLILAAFWGYLTQQGEQPVISVQPGTGLIIRHRATLRGHSDAVWCVAFSPDDRTLASAGVDRTIKLWDVLAGHEASLRTGYRRFNFDRYAAAVVWFCGRLRTVTPTSLNKLLFYADFQHFRTHAVSLTGAAYRRLPYGPVPADYGGLREQLELDQIVETREVKWQNGNVGEEYHVGPRAGELETSFSASELEILETVAEAFAEATPTRARRVNFVVLSEGCCSVNDSVVMLFTTTRRFAAARLPGYGFGELPSQFFHAFGRDTEHIFKRLAHACAQPARIPIAPRHGGFNQPHAKCRLVLARQPPVFVLVVSSSTDSELHTP